MIDYKQLVRDHICRNILIHDIDFTNDCNYLPFATFVHFNDDTLIAFYYDSIEAEVKSMSEIELSLIPSAREVR